MDNVIVLGIIAFFVGIAVGYIRKAGKRGVKCVGCPNASVCSGNCGGCK